MIYTTLNKIRAHGPCENGWRKLLKHLGKMEADDEPLLLLTVLNSNGAEDCLWCLRSVPEHDREWRLFAVWCARKVQHLMTDPRSIAALDVVERFANGEATAEELAAARAARAARDAGAAAWAAWDAGDAGDAAWAARAAGAAAWAAAGGTWATGAARAAGAAGDAGDAAWAAWDAAWAAQKQELVRIITSDVSTLAGG